MTEIIGGELQPRELIQRDTRACLSACVLSLTDVERGYTEPDVSAVLIQADIYYEGVGSGWFPARELDDIIGELGLAATPVYDMDSVPDSGILPDSSRTAARVEKLKAALDDKQCVLLAYAKLREGRTTLAHYAVASQFKRKDGTVGVQIMDPSDVDGKVSYPSEAELAQYCTPQLGAPVMAWGITRASDRRHHFASQVAIDSRSPLSLLDDPMWQAKDTGKPVPPGTNHPTSVVIPTVAASENYNSFGNIVLSRDGEPPVGYSRFVPLRQVRQLARVATGSYASLPFPTEKAARAAVHLEVMYDDVRTDITERLGLYWLSDTKGNNNGWQHTGLGISSRQAASALEGQFENDSTRLAAAEAKLKTLISQETTADPEDIYLFSTGMAGIYWLNQALINASGNAPTVQFGFPYTDTYRQRLFGPHRNASHNMIDLRLPDYDKLADLAGDVALRSVMTELPSNPLLWSPDLGRLDHILGEDTPIILDDTIGTMFNIDDALLPPSVAARVTSLTKYVSSFGIANGGAVILRKDSPHYDMMTAALRATAESTLWYQDAEALAANSDRFTQDMPIFNYNGEQIAGWLNEHWTGAGKPIKTVFHPSLNQTAEYDAVRKPKGGYNSLMSLEFNDPAAARIFFDTAHITKGPSFGTAYTLGCMYTQLAEKPTDSVKRYGVDEYLVRISLGIEPRADLQARMEEALLAAAA